MGPYPWHPWGSSHAHLKGVRLRTAHQRPTPGGDAGAGGPLGKCPRRDREVERSRPGLTQSGGGRSQPRGVATLAVMQAQHSWPSWDRPQKQRCGGCPGGDGKAGRALGAGGGQGSGAAVTGSTSSGSSQALQAGEEHVLATILSRNSCHLPTKMCDG